MTYERFEDTPAWQAAVTLGLDIFELVEDCCFDGQGDLRDQLQRSSLSMSNNIAEGFERGTTSELIQYLYIARGSAGETRSALRFADGRPPMQHLKRRIAELIRKAESLSRQLYGWANHLQNSDIPGQRRMTEQSQVEYRQKERTAKFLERLNEIRHGKTPPGGRDG